MCPERLSASMCSMTSRARIKDAGPASAVVTIRRAGPEDAPAVERLAALDSAHVPAGDLLVAQVGDELWAAMSLDGFEWVADPFKPSADVLLVLLERGRQLRRHRERAARRRHRPLRRGALAA